MKRVSCKCVANHETIIMPSFIVTLLKCLIQTGTKQQNFCKLRVMDLLKANIKKMAITLKSLLDLFIYNTYTDLLKEIKPRA